MIQTLIKTTDHFKSQNGTKIWPSMMTEQINCFFGQTVGNKKEESGINANLIQEHSISKVYNSHKEVPKIQRSAIQKILQNCFRKLEKHLLPPKGSRCAPALESDFLKQGFTFSIMLRFSFSCERINCFQNQTNIIKLSQSFALHLLVTI